MYVQSKNKYTKLKILLKNFLSFKLFIVFLAKNPEIKKKTGILIGAINSFIAQYTEDTEVYSFKAMVE